MDSDGFAKVHSTSQEILAYATRYGLTIADFKKISIGFVLDFLEIQSDIDTQSDIHLDEKNYNQMLSIFPIVEEKFKNGKISEKRYKEWIEKFKALEEEYG